MSKTFELMSGAFLVIATAAVTVWAVGSIDGTLDRIADLEKHCSVLQEGLDEQRATMGKVIPAINALDKRIGPARPVPSAPPAPVVEEKPEETTDERDN